MPYEIISISSSPDIKDRAALWFHEKWGIPLSAYTESMDECLRGESTAPQWYVAVADSRIVGGLGVIENDFHPRRDLAPNVCAVYTEEDCRGQGIAGSLLDFACRDMASRGVHTLYLVTDHDSFYERYGWEYLCPVISDGENHPSRIYVHHTV